VCNSRGVDVFPWGTNLYNDYSELSKESTLFVDEDATNLHHNFGCCFASGSSVDDVVDKPSESWEFHCRAHGEAFHEKGAGIRCSKEKLGRGKNHMVVPGNPATGLCEGGISKSIAEETEATQGICQRFADLAGLPGGGVFEFGPSAAFEVSLSESAV